MISGSKKDVKILVVCHKAGVMGHSDPYLPIHAGKALAKEELGILGDDSGDNISIKNPFYCELTAMYWAWKNLKGVDVIGLAHYRRYFDFHHQCRGAFQPVKRFRVDSFDSVDLSIPPAIIDQIQDGTALVASKQWFAQPLFRYYGKSNLADLIAIEEAIKSGQQRYVEAYNHVVGSRGCMSPYNMFIMTWRDFDAYCSWLFAVFSQAEGAIEISPSPLRPRCFGYIAEYLLNVYLYAHKFHLLHNDIIYFADQRSYADRNLFKRIGHRLWAQIVVPLFRKHRQIEVVLH